MSQGFFMMDKDGDSLVSQDEFMTWNKEMMGDSFDAAL